MYNHHNSLCIIYNKLLHLCGQIILTIFHSSIFTNYIFQVILILPILHQLYLTYYFRPVCVSIICEIILTLYLTYYIL